MCTPLNLETVQQSISQIKAEISSPAELVYTPAQAAADAEAGKLDINKISELFKDFPAESKKEAMKMASAINESQRQLANKLPVDFNFAEIEATEGKEFHDAFKAVHDAEVDRANTYQEELKAERPKIEAQISAAFQEMRVKAAEAEKNANAEKLSLITQLEELSLQMQSAEDITIAELLENDPEMRKEVEAEISANNWAP